MQDPTKFVPKNVLQKKKRSLRSDAPARRSLRRRLLGNGIAQRGGTDHSRVMASLIVEVPAYTGRDTARRQTPAVEGLEKRVGHVEAFVVTLYRELSVKTIGSRSIHDELTQPMHLSTTVACALAPVLALWMVTVFPQSGLPLLAVPIMRYESAMTG